MLPRVEEIVAAQLANDPVERIPDGYRLSNEFGVTDLTFRPVASDPGPFELSSIATVETRSLQDVPEFTSAGLARLNRRSVFGNFYKSKDGLRSKLTFSSFREELAAEWVAHLLLMAFERQLPFGIGAAQSELSEEHFRASRANLEGMGKASGVLPAEAISNVSAWSDLDFEQIHYDYAHLVIGSVAGRGWSQTYLDGGLLTLRAVDNHPHWGGGLLTLLRPSHRLFQTDEPIISTNELNVAAQMADDMPAFGAWCKRDDQFQFVSFAPNFLKDLPDFTDLMIETAVKRLRSTPALIQAGLAARPGFGSKH